MQALLPFIAAFVLAVAGTAAVRFIAVRAGLVLAPREDRWHSRPTALYGGVGIAVGVVGALVVLRPDALLSHPAALSITGGAVFLALVGLVDDASGLTPVTKLILQLAAATALVLTGATLPVTPFNPVNALLTLFWFVGIVNAVNLLDNMDGVAAGVAAVAAAGFAAFHLAAGDPVLGAVALATAGAAGGFLVFNFKPASIFMGDTGSLFLGGLLAGLGASYPSTTGSTGVLALLVPALVLLVPILDTTLVTVTRTIHNRRISLGGKDHSTHRLVAMGFSEVGAALFLYTLGMLALLVAWSAASARSAAGLWFGLLFLAGAMVFMGYLGRLHRYDDGFPEERRRRGVIIRNILLKRRGLELLLDVVLFGAAWYGAFVLHHGGFMSAQTGAFVNASLGAVIVAKLAVFHYFGVYRAVWHRPGLADVHRIAKGSVLAGLIVAAAVLVVRGPGVPVAVHLLDVLLTGSLAMGARASFGSLDRFRRRLRAEDGDAVLIEGAGAEAELVLGALDLDGTGGLRPVGFLDDSAPVGTLIQGVPVLGGSGDLPAVLAARRVRFVILTPVRATRQRLADAGEACRAAGVTLLTLNVRLESVAEEVGPRPASAAARVTRVSGAG